MAHTQTREFLADILANKRIFLEKFYRPKIIISKWAKTSPIIFHWNSKPKFDFTDKQ